MCEEKNYGSHQIFKVAKCLNLIDTELLFTYLLIYKYTVPKYATNLC